MSGHLTVDGARPHVATVSAAIASDRYPLTPSAKLVAYLLAADDYGKGTAPGRDNLAGWGHLPLTTVRRALCDLRTPPAGTDPLVTTSRTRAGEGWRTRYAFTPAWSEHAHTYEHTQPLTVTGERPAVTDWTACTALASQPVSVRLVSLVLALASTDGLAVTATRAELAAWTGLNRKSLAATLATLDAIGVVQPQATGNGYSASTLATYRQALTRMLADLDSQGQNLSPETACAWAEDRPRTDAAPARALARWLPATDSQDNPSDVVAAFLTHMETECMPLHRGKRATVYALDFLTAHAAHRTGGTTGPKHDQPARSERGSQQGAQQGAQQAQNTTNLPGLNGGPNGGPNRGPNRPNSRRRTGVEMCPLPNTLPFPTPDGWPVGDLPGEVALAVRGPLGPLVREARLPLEADTLARWVLVYAERAGQPHDWALDRVRSLAAEPLTGAREPSAELWHRLLTHLPGGDD